MLVIFDCDGVLVDTETLGAEVLQKCLQQQGISLSVAHIFDSFRGKSIAECGRQVADLLRNIEPYSALSEAALKNYAENFWQDVQAATLEAFEKGVQPIAGIDRVIGWLQQHDVPFVVASNGRHEKMQASLGATGLLSAFSERMFSATDVSEGKPAPDLFLLAAASQQVAPAKCIVIEDSFSGAKAARAAGMPLIAYCADASVAVEQAMVAEGGRVIHAMDELIPLLCNHFGLLDKSLDESL